MPMSAPRISAAMIVRDEEAVLEDCLRSIRDEVDEIVVTDTGSRDQSRDIAAGFGARVLERPWDDDFSAARNHSLDAVTGDWILYIDADERLDAPRRGTLRRTIARLAVIEEGLAALPEDHALRFMWARALINLHRHQSALEVLAGLTAHDALSFADPYLAYDRRIFGEFAHDLNGVALLRLGQFAEASAAFESAAAAAPERDRIRYRAKAAAAAAKAARAIEAQET
jgi:glycosyltransferase involved in cell wall biosynthesis